jgi:hypothetical protein
MVEASRRVPEGRDVIAHVAGVPLEELMPLVSGAGAALVLARAWMALHLRAGESREEGRQQ